MPRKRRDPVASAPPPLSEVPLPPEDSSFSRDFNCSGLGNSEFFIERHGDHLRFDPDRGTWLVWGEHSWRPGASAEAMELAKHTMRFRGMRSMRRHDDPQKIQKEVTFSLRSENLRPILDLLKLSETDPAIRVESGLWDRDPLLLGAANGVVDLRDGSLRSGAQSDLISRASPIPFDPLAPAPRWLAFIDSIFNGHSQLISFVQRALGYSLTGSTSEQCLFACYGTGANGKSTLLETVHSILGSLATATPFSTFEAHDSKGATNDLAALTSVRFVTASETGEDTRLNEARVKAITGGDTISARFHFKEFFTFTPVFKLWLAFNHRPVVRDDSEGFWRRVHLVPFEQEFLGSRADRDLFLKLRAEAPGILAWMVAGAVAWKVEGLCPPEEVTSATREYREESDPLSEFLESCCELGEGKSELSSRLYKTYIAWKAKAEGINADSLTQTSFGNRMVRKFKRTHSEHGKKYLGLSIRPDRLTG